jgi:hypothetical protein
MIPVNEAWAKGKKGWEHPGTALLEEIEEQTNGRIIRADTRIPNQKPAGLTQGQWNKFLKNVQEDQSADKLWIQFTVTD